MKKIISLVIAVLLIAAIAGLAGCYIGKNMSVKSRSITGKSELQDSELRPIAVVNLDEGTTAAGKEKIYYGEKVIQFSSDFFLYTSLEDARQGIENDTYSAYVIIPSTFSDSVESLNGTPVQAQLQYALNTELKGDNQTEVLRQVLAFGESLNTDLSYMYLANVLKEFHQAQDQTALVMENDLKDKDSIDKIQALDLVKMVSVPELKREENNTAPFDIAPYMEANQSLINDIDEKYKSNVEDTRQQLSSIGDSGTNLSTALGELSTNVGEINLTTDENGTNIYEGGLASLSNTLADFNDRLSGSKDTVAANIDALEKQRAFIAESLAKSMDDYNMQLHTETQGYLTSYRTQLSAVLPALTCAEVEGSNGMKYKLSCNEVEGKGTPPAVILSITSGETEENRIKRECIDIILNKISTTVQDVGKENVSILTVFAECDADVNLMGRMQSCGYTSSQIMFMDLASGVISMDSINPHITIEGNAADIENYMKSSFDIVDTAGYQSTPYSGSAEGADGNSTTITVLLDDYKTFIEKTQTGAASIDNLDSQGVSDIVNNQCIFPLVDRTDTVKKTFQQRYLEETGHITVYQGILKGYNPVVDTSNITANVSKMSENGSKMQQSVGENNQAYMDFANRVYMTAQENTMALQSHIQEAKEASEQAVTSGLADAKSIKSTTSEENQKAMEAFAGKLPFTRLGTMEYMQAYEFIANPLALSEVSDYQRLKDEVSITTNASKRTGDSEIQSSKNKKYVQWVLYAVLILLIIAAVISYLIRSRHFKQGLLHHTGN